MPRYLGHIFQGLLGQLALLDLLTVYSGKRYESVSFSQLLLLFFSTVESKGEFGLTRARGDSSFCVCTKMLLLPLPFSKFAFYCFGSPHLPTP